MKLLRNPKTRIWLTLGLSLFGLSVAGLSTFAWFQIETTKKTLDDSNVVQSGSPDLTITDIKGHKVVPTLSPNTGMTDYSNSTVTTMDGNMKLVGTNYDQDDADTDFDVPNDGIGYYVITPNATGAFKFAADGSNSWKFQEYDSQNFMYAADVDLPASTPFMIRSYTMAHNETVLSTVNIANDSFSGGSVSNNRATVSSPGRYKVWFDKGTNKVGAERTGNIPVRAKVNPKKLSGSGVKVYLKPNSNWTQANARFAAYVFNDSAHTNKWYSLSAVPGDAETYTCTIGENLSDWEAIIFCRMDPNNLENGWGSQKWNQTGNLSFPADTKCRFVVPNGAWDGSTTGWGNYNPCYQVSIGGGSYQDMTWNNGEWQLFNVTASDGASLAFKDHVGSVITGTDITATSDNSNVFNDKNSFDGSSKTIIKGGTDLKIYFHTDKSVWVSRTVHKAEIKVGTNSYDDMTWDASGDGGSGEWSYTITAAQTGPCQLLFKCDGYTFTATKKADDAFAWYNKNNLNSSIQIIRPVENITVYLSKGGKVWVDCVVEIKAGSGDWVRMSTNPNNSNELMATGLTASDGSHISMQVNGDDTFAYAINPADGNNINGSGNVIRGGAIEAYIAKNTQDGQTTKQLWITKHGYELKIGSGSYTTMDYDGNGVFSLSNQNVATNDALTVRNDSGTVITETSYDSSATNNVKTGASGPAIKCGGTGVKITYNSGTKKFEVSAIYQIKVGSSAAQQATSNGSCYEISSTATADDAVKFYLNGVEQTSYSPEADRDGGKLINNCYGTTGALKVGETVTSAVTFSFNTSTSTAWIDGHSRVFMIKFGSNAAVPMTDVKDGSQASYTVSSTVAASTAITITTSGGTNIAYTAKTPTVLNNLSDGSTISEISSGTIYFNYNTSQLWVPGKQQTYYFYTREASASLKMWQTGAGSEGDAIAMTQDGTDPHLFSYTYTVSTSYDYLRFIAGDRQSEEVNISESDCSGRYYYMTEDATDGEYGLRNETNPAGILTNAKMYLYDAGNYFAGTHNALIHKSSGSIVPYGGADYPGIAMTEVIPSALWVITGDQTNYDKIRFTGSYVTSFGTKESAVLDFTESNNNKVWVTTDIEGRTVKGGFATETAHSSTVGTATIHVRRGGAIVDSLETPMGLGDVVDSNLFIYEKGLRVQDGDVLTIEITGNADVAKNREYNNSDFVSDTRKRPYLDRSGTNITVDLGSSGATGRFNFYLTNEYKVAIVEVPDMGNGFYIMDYKNDDAGTENYLDATKMATSSSATASYSGYYAQKDDQIFVRSYVNAVDKGYTTLVNNTGKTISMSDGIITFGASDYYNISVSNGKVIIDLYEVDDFFRLNPLDTSKAGTTDAIKTQKTAIVLEVSFTCENAYQSIISLDVTNGLSYVGAALYVTDTPVDSGLSPVSPYNFMRDNHYSLSAANATSIADSHTNFKTTANDGGTVYRAYILIDYLPQTGSGAWDTYPEDSNIAFYLRSTQA